MSRLTRYAVQRIMSATRTALNEFCEEYLLDRLNSKDLDNAATRTLIKAVAKMQPTAPEGDFAPAFTFLCQWAVADLVAFDSEVYKPEGLDKVLSSQVPYAMVKAATKIAKTL